MEEFLAVVVKIRLDGAELCKKKRLRIHRKLIGFIGLLERF